MKPRTLLATLHPVDLIIKSGRRTGIVPVSCLGGTIGDVKTVAASKNLEVHHKKLRSQCGDDSQSNLITLCHICHSDGHPTTTSALSQNQGICGDRND